ncbi:hypothetical protein LWX53_05565 [bacterium]|nr:hypothetical protein [bacterium]
MLPSFRTRQGAWAIEAMASPKPVPYQPEMFAAMPTITPRSSTPPGVPTPTDESLPTRESPATTSPTAPSTASAPLEAGVGVERSSRTRPASSTTIPLMLCPPMSSPAYNATMLSVSLMSR